MLNCYETNGKGSIPTKELKLAIDGQLIFEQSVSVRSDIWNDFQQTPIEGVGAPFSQLS